MNRYKLLFTSVIMLAFSGSILSQDSEKQSQVHLKDGSILVGEIIEDTDFYILLATSSLDTMEIGYKHILGIGNGFQAQRFRKTKPPIVLKESGFYGNASFGLIERRGGDFDGLRASLTVGKRMSKRLNLGFEVGRQNHVFTNNFAYGENTFLTLGLNGRYFLNVRPHRWFLDASVGYAIATGGEDFPDYSHLYKGGVNSQISAGRQWSLNNTLGIFFKIGIGYQHVTGNISQNWDWNMPIDISYRKENIYPSILIGVEF